MQQIERSRVVSIVLGLLWLTVACSATGEPPAPTATESEQLEAAAHDHTSGDGVPANEAQGSTPMGAAALKGAMPMAKPDPALIEFRDNVTTNAEVPASLKNLVFKDTGGKRIRLEQFLGKKHVVLVFTEGFDGMLCPFCTTQTSRLVANYQQFVERMAEVLVVYPGERGHLDEFVEAARTTNKQQVDRVPFPIELDEDFVAVDFFNIRSKQAHPSTYIIDKSGNVPLAYVGAGMTADRPSIQAILDQLDAANASN